MKFFRVIGSNSSCGCIEEAKTMVQYRKPLERSENIIDRRGATAAETAAARARQALVNAQARAAAKREHERLVKEALALAEKQQRLRGTGRR